ncbi:DNA (cytosine-5-)-methyltransferase [Arthrobacter dokdonensis]|uniref:DNA (cytosine-5-)-methyltransferase n=1 Tax=Arthrobacter dokdonellae TaxID=2211210 RepID=UPI0022B26FD6|nr:DNA (cytosine-5-)-methyltransferase [Arthrobacter dokdonellae]
MSLAQVEQAARTPFALLRELRGTHSQAKLATTLEVSVKTIARWETGETECPPYLRAALEEILKKWSLATVPAPAGASPFRFVDLFAGIGGIRLAFESIGGNCVFTSEWNKYAQQTYARNFGHSLPGFVEGFHEDPEGHLFAGDITQVHEKTIPDHDVLLAGFPCQPFSIAGVSKKNSLGREHGFADATQGTLFFDVARIIDEKQPQAFLLENVKNLLSHDMGRTFRVIERTLREELGYEIDYKVVNANSYVPQGRQRIMIVGFKDASAFEGVDGFTFDNLTSQVNRQGKSKIIRPTMASILHPEDGTEVAEVPYTEGELASVGAKYTLTPNLWKYLKDYAAKHRAAGNGFGYGLVGPESVARTLSARYHKDGSEILVSRGIGERPRRLTPRECARLMGFPDSYEIPVSDTQAYRQFGNSVVVPAVTAVAEEMRRFIK